MNSNYAATRKLTGNLCALLALMVWITGFTAPQDAIVPAVDEAEDLQKIITGLAIRQYQVRSDAKKALAELKPPYDAAVAQVNVAWGGGEIDSAEREKRMTELKTQYELRRTKVIEERNEALAEIQREADRYAAEGRVGNATIQ